MNIAVVLVALHGFHGQIIYVNPDEVVSIRAPTDKTTLSDNVKCLLTTVDGKGISVSDDCDTVIEKFEEAK